MTVGVMAVGTVPDTAGVEGPAAGIYAKSSTTKTKEKSENVSWSQWSATSVHWII